VKIMEKVHIKKENKVRVSYHPQCSGLTPCLIHSHHIISCRSKRS
jgi:hypothetical protein